MNVLVYESTDRMLISVIKEVLDMNAVAYNITGLADTGLTNIHPIKVFVSEKDTEKVLALILEITKN